MRRLTLTGKTNLTLHAEIWLSLWDATLWPGFITGLIAGQGGFNGPPDADGVVEIAYMVEPEHQGKGYATEAAHAFSSGQVRIVRAHTLAESNASARVLIKCGFRHIGEVIDPEDGMVWRWEKHDEADEQHAR